VLSETVRTAIEPLAAEIAAARTALQQLATENGMLHERIRGLEAHRD
jgi:hypothetical protein